MASSRRSCKNHPDVFCYICGEHTLEENRKPVTGFVKRAYLECFGVKLGDQDKIWAPHIVCKTCTEHLRQWTNGKRSSLKFGVPIILPPLHIKLGLMKQFVRALNKEGACFGYISNKFPGLSIEKLKSGIFDGPQIRQLIGDPNFTDSMDEIESATWSSFVQVVKNFLGKHKAGN